MPDYIEVHSGDAGMVRFEVDDYDGPVQAGRRLDKAREYTEASLDDGIEHAKTIAKTVVRKISDLPQRPERITIEIGLKATADAGMIIAKSSAEAHIAVSLEWGHIAVSLESGKPEDSSVNP